MKISPSGGMSISTAHTVLTASEVAGEGSTTNKSSFGPDPITVTLNVLVDNYEKLNKENDDGNYYGITFPGDYIGVRGDSKDPFAAVRTGTGPIDYSGGINVILNIPAGMNIGANTSGNFGSTTLGGAYPATGAKYEKRAAWDSGWTGAAGFGQYLSDPSLIINLDTDEWSATALENLNITINNSGNTIGAGGSGGYGGRTKHGGGGGGGGQGLHPSWAAGTRLEYADDFTDGDWLAGQGGGGFKVGQSGGGSDGVQGTINGGGAAGAKGGSDAGAGAYSTALNGHAGGSAIYVKSNVASSTTGTTINIVNQSGGRMYGGGGGGAGGYSVAGSVGGGMLTSGTFGGTTVVGGVTTQGGWQGSILWVDSTNLTVANTITNNDSHAIVGWDGTWAPGAGGNPWA